MKAHNGLTISIACTCALAVFAARAQVPPERAAAARKALMSWFECAECTNGELDAVTRYAREVEGALAYTLRNGPSPAKRAKIESELRAQWDANAKYAKATAKDWPENEADFVRTNLENAERTYRMRAITALAALKTPGAAKTLKEASDPQSKLPVDIRQAALDALRAPP